MTLHRQVTEALWQIDARGEADGWDGPSRFYFLLAVPGRDASRDCHVIEFPDWQRHPDTGTALAVLEAGLRIKPPPRRFAVDRSGAADYAVIGVILATEVWVVRGDPAGEMDVEHPSRHPDRVEMRMTLCVLADGWRGLLLHERDGVPDVFTTDDEEVPEGAQGRIVDSLERVLAAARRSEV
jgi:hypothetical protein